MSEKKQYKTITLDVEIHEKLEEVMKYTKLSKVALVRLIIAMYLDDVQMCAMNAWNKPMKGGINGKSVEGGE